MHGANDFTLELEEGVNVVATYPLTQLPSLVVQTLQINSSDEVIVEGSLGMSLGALATGSVDGTQHSRRVFWTIRTCQPQSLGQRRVRRLVRGRLHRVHRAGRSADACGIR